MTLNFQRSAGYSTGYSPKGPDWEFSMTEERKTRILCVGNEPDLLQLRCAVLGKAGYDSTTATIPEAEILLLTEQFDLVVLSSRLSKGERTRVLAVAGATKMLALDGVTFPAELLTGIERILRPMSQ
jgi:CheY-like chemotaxis protein